MRTFWFEFKAYVSQMRAQDLPFIMACGYIVFSYMRPQAIYPALDILPWTQICILIGLGSSIMRREFSIGSVHLLMLLFVTAVWLSIAYSLYPEISRSKSDVIVIWFVEILFFVNCVKSSEQLKLIVIMFFITMFKMSFFGARTWAGRGFGFTKWGIAGPAGFFANSGEFSLLMAIVAVMSIGFLVGMNRHRSFYLLLPITAIMTVMGASSRGGQIAIVAGLLFLVLAYKKVSFKYLLVIGVAGYLIYSLMPAEQLQRFQSIGKDNTSQSRLDYWVAGWDMMKEYPITGVGYYGFAEHYDRYYKVPDPNAFLTNRKEVAHNSFIEIASTTGIVGLTAYLTLLYYIHRSAVKVRKFVSNWKVPSWHFGFALGLQASLVVYVVGSAFMSVAFYPYLYLLLMLSFLNLKVIEKSKIREDRVRAVN